jgi:hypothetical protein
MASRTSTSGGCGLRNYNLGNDMAARHTIHDTGMNGQIGAYNEGVEMAELTMDGHLP